MRTMLAQCRFQETIPIALLLTLAFALFYGGGDWLGGMRGERYFVHFPFELSIPFVPAAAPLYLSVQLILVSLVLIFPTGREISPVAFTLLFEMITAFVVFVASPAQLAFQSPPAEGFWGPLISLADLLNLDLNLVPSLHVAFAVSAAEMIADKLGPRLGRIFRLWAGLIAVSTLLLHQHHVVDVLTGVFLALVSTRIIYHQLKRPS